MDTHNDKVDYTQAFNTKAQHWCKEALAVQSACNLSGVVFSMNRMTQDLCEVSHVENKGTDWRNHHPIVVLFTDKLASLCGLRTDSVRRYSWAYEWCTRTADGDRQGWDYIEGQGDESATG